MNMLSALYFPLTVPERETLRKLLMFFSSITSYRPVEDVPPVDADLIREGYMDEYAPVPLGQGRDNFLKFITDVRLHGAEYMEGLLSSLSSQSLTDQDESSIWSIVSNISGRGGAQNKDSRQHGLWQARFLLQLAEIQVLEDRELLEQLRETNSRKQQILNSLHGSDSTGFTDEDHPDLYSLASSQPLPTPVDEKKMLMSWSRLFLADKHDVRPGIMATADKNVAASILDICNTIHGNENIHLGTIKVPVPTDILEENFPADREHFLLDMQDIRKEMAAALHRTARAASLSDAVLQEIKTASANNFAAWNERLQGDKMVANETGLAHIEFYVLPGISPSNLFQRYARTHEISRSEQEELPNTILAVLT